MKEGFEEKKSLHTACTECLFIEFHLLCIEMQKGDRGVAWTELHSFSRGYTAACGKPRSY